MMKMKRKLLFITNILLLSSCSQLDKNINDFYQSSINNQVIGLSYVDKETKNTMNGIIDYNGNIIVEFGNYEILPSSDYEYYSVNSSKNSYVIKDGTKLTTNFKYISQFENDTAIVQSKDGLYGLVNCNLEIIINPIFDSYHFFYYGNYIMKKDSKVYCGFGCEYNEVKSNIVNRFIYDEHVVYLTSEEKEVNGNNLKYYGLIDAKGNVIFENEYTSIISSNDLIIAIKNGNNATLYNMVEKNTISNIIGGYKVYDSSFYASYNSETKTITGYKNGSTFITINDETLLGVTENYIVTMQTINNDDGDVNYQKYYNKNGNCLKLELLSKNVSTSSITESSNGYICYSINNYAVVYDNNFNEKIIINDFSKVTFVSDYLLECINLGNSSYEYTYKNLKGKDIYKDNCTNSLVKFSNNLVSWFSYQKDGANIYSLKYTTSGKSVTDNNICISNAYLNAYITKDDNNSTVYNLYGKELLTGEEYSFVTYINPILISPKL